MRIEQILERNFTQMTDTYRTFALQKDGCRMCEMYDHHQQVGQSEGNPDQPQFMFIGEALGRDEQEQVRPFIGRAGQRLRQALRKHKNVFTRKNTLISNVLICRPPQNRFPIPSKDNKYKTWPDNRKKAWTSPQGSETARLVKDIAEFCFQRWLVKEIGIVKPKVIITLGAKPLKYLFGLEKITENRGEWKFIPEFKCWGFPTFHPSYVLRCERDEHRSYVCTMFEQDINKIARTWSSFAHSDRRMRLSEEQWKKERSRIYMKAQLVKKGVV